MVKLVLVTGAKAPSPHWVLWGHELVIAIWQLRDSQKQFALKRRDPTFTTPPYLRGTPTTCSLSLDF